MSGAAQQARYNNVAITLHWLIAAGIIANIALGLYFSGLPHSDPNKFILTQTHKSIGLTILVLSVVRVGWRLINPAPPLPAGMSPFMRFAARTSHFLLYFLILAIPLSGWALVSASPLGLPTMYFGLFPWPELPVLSDLPRAMKRVWSHDFGTIHVYLAWSMIVLASIHILAALNHQFVLRDEIFARMFPPAGGAKKA